MKRTLVIASLLATSISAPALSVGQEDELPTEKKATRGTSTAELLTIALELPIKMDDVAKTEGQSSEGRSRSVSPAADNRTGMIGSY